MIVMFLADGFEETEAIAPLDILKRAGCDIITVGIGNKKNIIGSHGIDVIADIADSELSDEKVDGVILPGGIPGALNLEKSEIVNKCLKQCYENGKLVSAICASPFILGQLGMLKGKEAICYPGYENKLEGAILSGDGVCADGNIVTAKGAGMAIEFGLKLVEVLKSKEASDKIKASMQCR